MRKPPCVYEKACSGCQLLGVPYAEQENLKIQNLRALFVQNNLSFAKDIEFLSAGEFFLRDRLDFTWQEGKLGLFSKGLHEILDLDVCLQLSAPLQEWLTDFRKIRWPMKKASFRLRISPQAQRGLWIDAANLDIKALLEEKEILRQLQKNCFVEMGQKRKTPRETSSGFKLMEPELHVWFETQSGEKKIPLYCQVASFTQPSLAANQLITRTLRKFLQASPPAHLLEFGSGIGNLTLAALPFVQHLTACEVDKLALEGLQKTLHEAGLSDRVTLHAGDFQRKLTEDFSVFDAILGNPPRSGLLHFLDPLKALAPGQRPQSFIYMSCFPESLVADLARLQSFGYSLQQVVMIDQFPQTSHYEVMVLLQR